VKDWPKVDQICKLMSKKSEKVLKKAHFTNSIFFIFLTSFVKVSKKWPSFDEMVKENFLFNFRKLGTLSSNVPFPWYFKYFFLSFTCGYHNPKECGFRRKLDICIAIQLLSGLFWPLLKPLVFLRHKVQQQKLSRA